MAANEELSVFAQRLKQLRQRRRISRIVLSELCGLHRNAVSRYERGTMPSFDSLIAIADFFGVSTDYLLGRDSYDT
ncbi:MAG: helix-turn-helix domain-containing protein [Oscillospiraceae bacterium]|nr:helix-turn-helix domain-containing protein [Oscillospiraceae bacterium]